MAKLVALYTVVVNVLANAGLMVSDETAKQIRQVCTWANVKFTFPKLEDAVMDFYMLSLKYYRLLHERGTHTTDDWLARNMVKAFRQNRDENKFGGVIHLLKDYIQKETAAFLNGSQESIDFTLEPKDQFIGAINSWIRDGFITVNGEALRSRLVKLFNLDANVIIMHVSKDGTAESFRLVSTFGQKDECQVSGTAVEEETHVVLTGFVPKQEEQKDNTVNNISDSIVKLPSWRQRAIAARVNRVLGTSIEVKNLATHAIESSKIGEAIRHEFDALATTSINYGDKKQKYELTEEAFNKYDLVITVTKYSMNGKEVEVSAPCRLWFNKHSNTGYVKKTDESVKSWFWFTWNKKFPYPAVYEKGQKLSFTGHEEYDMVEKKMVRLLTAQESRNRQIVMAIYNKLKEIQDQTA